MDRKITKFTTMRVLPQISSTLYLIEMENKRRLYAMLPDEAEMSRDTIQQYKIKNSLFSYLMLI